MAESDRLCIGSVGTAWASLTHPEKATMGVFAVNAIRLLVEPLLPLLF